MKVYYKIMNGIEVLPEGFYHGNWYEIREKISSINKKFIYYKIKNDTGKTYTFNDIEYGGAYYIWRYFYTEKEIRKLKLENIC